MKRNHLCKERKTCDNYIYSTCEGCNLYCGFTPKAKVN